MLVEEHGAQEGVTRMSEYLVMALKMMPEDPTFIEARDAFLGVTAAASTFCGRLFCLPVRKAHRRFVRGRTVYGCRSDQIQGTEAGGQAVAICPRRKSVAPQSIGADLCDRPQARNEPLRSELSVNFGRGARFLA